MKNTLIALLLVVGLTCNAQFVTTGTATATTVYTNGKVGIGTSSPQSAVHIEGPAGIQSKLAVNNPTVGGGGASVDLVMGTGSSSFASGMRGYVPAGQPGFDRVFLGFYTTTYSGSLQSRIERLTISDNGNVGIGTTNPGNRLEIRSWSDNPLLYIYQDKNTGGTQDVFFLRDDRGYAGDNSGTSFKVESWKGSGHQGGTLANFITINDGVSTSRLLIDNHTGNVGVGTTSPEKLLQLTSGDNPTLAIGKSGTNTNGKSSLAFYSGTSTNSNGFVLQYLRNAIEDRLSFIDGGGSERISVLNGGNVGIGTTSPDAKLTVKGQIHAQEVKVDLSVPGPDYVFEKDYALPTLESVKTYIDQNKHLPEVPSAKEMEANGINLSEMNMLLLRKIEELTLYVIDQNKEIDELKKRSVSPDASGKKVEELTLYMIELKKENEELKKGGDKWKN